MKIVKYSFHCLGNWTSLQFAFIHSFKALDFSRMYEILSLWLTSANPGLLQMSKGVMIVAAILCSTAQNSTTRLKPNASQPTKKIKKIFKKTTASGDWLRQIIVR